MGWYDGGPLALNAPPRAAIPPHAGDDSGLRAPQHGRFPFPAAAGSFRRMNTITAILEPNADGTLHLPLPEELRHGKVKVEAKLEAANAEQKTPEPGSLKGFGALKGKIQMAPDFDEPADGITPQPGCLKGFWMAPDFDEPLEDFKEYME